MEANPFHKSTVISRALADPSTGCWEWQGYKNQKGYGMVNIKAVMWQAHRLAYTLWKGAIPVGLWILHKCDNSSCCNPLHLYAGTAKQNSDDKYERGNPYFVQGMRSVNRKFTDDQIREIRNMVGEKRHGYLSEAARKFNTNRTIIWRIVKRKCYREVT